MLRIEQLCKSYQEGNQALRDVSLKVEAGEFVVVLGKSGSGKSTLLRCINRLVEPTSGRIFLNDEEITGASNRQLRKLRQKIGMVFQQYNLVSRCSVRTNVLTGKLASVSTPASLFNFFPRDDFEKARHVLNRLGIADKEEERADKLSGGQQQRVGLARALMQEPQLILADEPVSSLDPLTSKQIMNLLKEFNQKDGVAVICNLHLPSLAREYGSRIIALNEGRVVYDGPATDLSETELHTFYDSQ
ncbi:MAG: phosphonate ABC transporter ATP-binding protein [Nitrospinae bacterium]|nr:phosphonate ABC transporter ATP-binding protein [Nitrospinota bacterium]MZH13966.1 phosphonate ABC transporter ATP-binding protein [Nitrospinota bacterium]